MKSDNEYLNNLVEGWRFELIEISANYYRIEGINNFSKSQI